MCGEKIIHLFMKTFTKISWKGVDKQKDKSS